MARSICRRLFVLLPVVGLLVLVNLATRGPSTQGGAKGARRELVHRGQQQKALLRGRPGDALVNRLNPEVFYLTAATGRRVGLTNQIMSNFNLIYLSILSKRTPIVPPIFSNWQMSPEFDLPALVFSSVFDIALFATNSPHLRQTGILEWHDVHGPHLNSSEEVDPIWPEVSCWGELFVEEEDQLRFARTRPVWHRYPGSVLPTGSKSHFCISHQAFVPYLLPSSPIHDDYAASLLARHQVAPGGSFACIDNLYYSSDQGTHSQGEYKKGIKGPHGSGGWGHVGRHLKFQPALVRQAETMLRKIFDVKKGEKIPPFVAMHIRHGDFRIMCKPGDTCLTTSQYAVGLARLQQDYQKQTKTNATSLPFPTEVLVFSDDAEPEFVDEIHARGWKTVADGRGVESRALLVEFDGWYQTLLETVLLSMGTHFVGTAESTMSLLAALRTSDWNGGLTRKVWIQDPS